MNIDEFRRNRGYVTAKETSILHLIRQKFSFGKCTKSRTFHFLRGLFPVTSWLADYRKSYIFSDIVSGITVGAMHIPQGLSYSLLAGQHPIYGLYSSFFPVFWYFIFGTSKHLSVGIMGLTSIIIGSAMTSLVPEPSSNSTINASLTEQWENVYEQRIILCSAMSLIVGLLMIVCSILHLGSIMIILSRPLMKGFTFGGSIVVIISQLKSLLGLKTGSYAGVLSNIWTLRDIFQSITSLDAEGKSRFISSLIISIISITFLCVVRFVNAKYRDRFPFKVPIPGELLVIIFGTLISFLAKLNQNFNAPVVGNIPQGLPPPTAPSLDNFDSIILYSISILIAGFAITTSLADIFADRGEYKINHNQELFAFGVSNIFGSFFLCMPTFAVMSRTCIQFESGGKTQIVSLIAAAVVLLVILVIGPVFEHLPMACLASIVCVGVTGLLDVRTAKFYWQNYKPDFAVFLFTCCATLILDMVIGIAAGACFALLIVLIRTHFTKLNQLGKLLQSEIYETTDLFPKVDLDDNIIVLSYNAPIDYLNVKFFKKSMLRLLRRKINDPTAVEITEFELETFDPDQIGSNQTSPAVSVNKGIVLDCSGIKFVDSVGVDGIVKILQEFEKSNWNFVFSNCSDDFLRSFSSISSFEILLRSFPTVHEAVLYLKTL